MSSRSAGSLAWLMLLLFLANGLSADLQFAMVMVSGVASLNGTAISRSDWVRAGDSLETGPNSALTIDTKGSTIMMGGDTRARYLGDSLDLRLGLAQINTSQRFRVVTDTIKIEPNAMSAKFRIDRSVRTVVITALEGELRVDNNGVTRIVPSGTTSTLSQKDQDEPASPVRRKSNLWFFWPAAGAVTASSALIWTLDHKKRPISNQIP